MSKTDYSASGVFVERGERYHFEVDPNQRWRDGDIVCGPEGWRSSALSGFKRRAVEALESRRRYQFAPWFVIIGAVENDGDNQFSIGKGIKWTMPSRGELFTYANDVSLRCARFPDHQIGDNR